MIRGQVGGEIRTRENRASNGELRVMHVVIDLETGGAQTLIRNLAERRETITYLSLVVIKGQGALSTELERVCDDVYYLNYESSTIDFPGIALKIQRLTRSNSIGILHTHLLHSDLVGAMVSTRDLVKVSTVHTTGMSAKDPLRSRLIAHIVAKLSFRFDGVVACSTGAKSYMRTMGYRLRNSHVILNGVPMPSNPVRSDERRFVSLARWHPMKDHKNLFSAFAASGLPDHGWQLHCAGNGMDSDNKELEKLIDENGLRDSVHLHGSLTDVGPLLSNARALVLSSLYGEALPMAALEALSHGVPVVATDVGAAGELALDIRLLVPAADSDKLAASLVWTANLRQSDLDTLHFAALKLIREDYEISSTVRRYEELYSKLLETRKV